MTNGPARRISLAEARGLRLAWVKPSFRRADYVLRAGDHDIATLRVTGARGTRAQGEFADQAWTIESGGPWMSKVIVREPGHDADVAVLAMSMWGGGLVDFARGGQFRWRRRGFGGRRWLFATYGHEPLLTFSHRISWRRRAVEVEVDPAAWALRELPVLLLLGAYLMRRGSRAT